MPERPKRRKNNKNKRKNNKPLNQIDTNKNNVEPNETSVIESSSNTSEQIVDSVDSGQTLIDIEQTHVDSDTLTLSKNSIPDESSEVKSLELKDTNDINEEIEKEKNFEGVTSEYIVETPEQVAKVKPKLDNSMKSKSCDNDDSPTIVEITDDTAVDTNLPIVESNNIIISSEESSNVRWEEVDSLNLPATELIKGVLSSDTIPLNIVRCEQIKSLSPEEESSLRSYLKTLNLSTNPSNFSSDIKTELEHLINREVTYRLRKKGFAEDNLYERAGPSRSLAVIDEEGSGDSSKTSRRHSYLSDKKSDNEELEDDVFENKQIQINKNVCMEPKYKQTSKHLIPQKCIRVDAKIKEPQISEARGDWTLETVEQMTGAELVYLTDSSSSTSSIYDVNEELNKSEETDVSVRMITPTIEVTDTEKLLSNVYFAENMNSNDAQMSDLNKSEINVQQQDKIGTEIFEQKATENIIETKKDANRTENTHEIVVLSTDNIRTNLFVKELVQVGNNEKIKNLSEIPGTSENIEEIIINRNPIPKPPEDIDEYDLEIKVLKCELNDAINNLIKEVTSDSENNNGCSKDTFSRQDSSSSLDSSQCTAKYNPNYSSLNDVSNILQDEKSVTVNKLCVDGSSSHVKDVLQSVASKLPLNIKDIKIHPVSLRDICLSKIASFPFGHKILEELANVSERLQNSVLASQSTQFSKHENLEKQALHDKTSNNIVSQNKENHVPPPIKPRRSSLRKKSEEQNKPVITKTEVCLSPSQKMLMEKTNTIVEPENMEQKDAPTPKMPIPPTIIPTPLHEDKKIYKNLAISEMPMKSQTGSRLLALLLDSSQSSKLNSSTIIDNNLRDTPRIKTNAEIFSKRAMEEIDSANFSDASTDSRKLSSFKSNNFKPVPPPKPKKLCSYSYESDERSDFRETSFRSMHNNRKYFHFSTGTLNKEIESDISSIQNMHRYYTNLRNNYDGETTPRRPSLPKDLCDKQMEYICQKEKEVDAEIQRLEQERNKVVRSRGPRAPMISDKSSSYIKTSESKPNNFSTAQNLINSERKVSSLFSSSQEELLREKMYSEYVSVMAEREQRKKQKVIKITKTPGNCNISSKSMPTLENLDSKVNNPIEQEFISKARERWHKLGIYDPESEDEKEYGTNVYREPKVIEHKIKVIDAGVERDVQKLPNHVQDFVKFTVKIKDDGEESTETVMIAPTFKARSSSPAIWRPGAPTQAGGEAPSAESPSAPPPPPPPVWTPNTTSPQTPRKSFRPVHFEDTPPPRRKFGSSDQNGCTSGSESEGRLRTSQSAPATGLNTLGSSTSRLPRAQNPTVTLLQKAREGQIPRGPSNIPSEKDPRLPRDRPSPPKGDPVHALRKEYASEGEGDRSDYERSQKMNDSKKKIEGIGPTTKDGMPVALRSEVKDPSRWYKKMYDTIHKNKFDEDYVTIRYKNRRGEPQRPSSNRSQYAYFDPRSGYLSEPEGGLRLTSSTWSDAYDSDVATGPRRRTASVQEERRFDDMPYLANNKYSTLASARARQEVYKGQPGRIENYMPGKSSVIDKEAKQWWDEVMDIFDGQNGSVTPSQSQASPKEKKDLTSAILSKSNMARALKESGYESDSTLIFRRRENTEAPLSPAERHAAYRDLQAGGEPPLRGFRSPAPPRQDESEIEYIPISSTLTKIRVHKRSPQLHEVICYPVTNINTNYHEELKSGMDHPPIPPRRISSKNSRTLKLVTSSGHTSTSPMRQSFEQSNVEFLKDKISNKLNRQKTHVIIKRDPSSHISLCRAMSTSAPPALNRNKNIIPLASTKQNSSASSCKKIGTSSFSSPRRRILPINYSNTECRPRTSSSSVIIEGGAGRKTPITNILDRVTSLDKLWSAQKRNERIDLSKIKPKSALKSVNTPPKSTPAKVSISINPKAVTTVTHKSRDMTRTSERIQKMKLSNAQAKSTSCLAKTDTKSLKPGSLQTMLNLSKSTPQIPSLASKKQNQIKTATVTTIKKKKSIESVLVQPRNTVCHEQNIKKHKEINKYIKKVKNPDKKQQKHFLVKSDNKEEFGDVLDEMSNFGSNEDFDKHSKEIRQARNDIISDSFFQNLLLRKPLTSISVVNTEQKPLNIVQQKAKLFQSLPESNFNTSNLINTYLIHRKPVTLSRFKMWDRQISPMRIQDARSISWPGKMDGKIRKFDSLTYCDSEFGSTSSLATIRSRSEPPINKLYFSQTSRPVSPTVLFHKKNLEAIPIKTSPSPTRFLFLPSSSTSPKLIRKFEKSLTSTKLASPEKINKSSLSVSPTRESDISDINDKIQATMYFSQTSRPVSPKVINKRSTSRSQSPLPVRSPSYRRIHNARTHSKLETISKVLRTRSADSSEKDIKENKVATRTKSDSNIYTNDPEYDEYIRDIQNIKGRSERFRELNRYYSYLERVAELEKATSSRNMCYRKKDEEIIDFDRWKKIRTIERAEEELNNLYTKLKRAQNENDVLFYPKDVSDVRWNFNRERGLRTKEKSVEDLKEELQNKNFHEIVESEQSQCKDKYKPLWRGTSVAETAFSINKKNKEDKRNYINAIKPKTNQQLESLTDLRKKIGLGNRLWSSLSMDQVNALKNQLNAIYSKECESKSNKDDEKYVIEVKNTKSITNPGLHVRCNSLGAPVSKIHKPELSKSESIGAITFPLNSEKDLKNNVNKMQMTLSENEKKRISQSLSKEVLNRMSKYDTISKQEDKTSTSSDANHKKEYKDIIDVEIENIQIEPKVQPNDKKTRHVVYPAQKIEISNQSSASETETGSSDISGATVIYKAPKKEVQKKVEYFESVKKDNNPSSTLYQAIENSEGNSMSKHVLKTPNISETKPEINQIFQSQSCANIKELFGESDKNKFLSLPLKPDLYSRSPSPQSETYVSDRRTPDTLRFSSDETIWRSRSPSPDPERYWRAYVKLAREGEVRRLARRFDSPSAAGAVLRRYRSDPEIIRNDFKNKWTTTGRTLNDKSRALLPVARMPLRPSNRYMPHIDVISKLAALRRRNPPRSRSAEEALECRPGEVERIRRRFEAMSLLGQIYTSAPDVRELHSIASYLKGPWIAHRYPKPDDNNRSIQDPTTLIRGRTTPSKRDKKHGHQDLVKLNSILKNESLAKQIFDPSAHRPASRYEPPREPPRPPPASWPYRLGPHITPSRHTVTFQETDSAPEPPRRVSHSSYSDSESPSRRYVESDVNIHYRCPVRHDPLPLVPERELARQQAEHMKRLYREQRRNKYLQELQDMQNRRHQDNFMPSQKTIVPLNRYDEAEKIIAKALYTFNGQTSRELSFRKGDIINVRRQIDSNWYEGEVHGKVGLFPYNYVELLKSDGVQTLKKPTVVEGRARAKFDFIAQTNLELPLKKGEVVVLTRRIDHNWWEGRNGNKTGIFPDSYVTILQEPSQSKPESQPIISTPKPAASPAAHGLINGVEARGMSAHRYTPQLNSPALSNAPPADLPLQGYITKSTSSLSASERGYGPPTGAGVDLNNSEPLYVDTNAEAVPYRAMYKYRPQNPDELELNEGDTVYVLEKCDDGWYVGSSQRTGRFGTFPGNYVERI